MSQDFTALARTFRSQLFSLDARIKGVGHDPRGLIVYVTFTSPDLEQKVRWAIPPETPVRVVQIGGPITTG